MSQRAACPLCGHMNELRGSFKGEICDQCGAVLGVFEFAPDPGPRHQPADVRGNAEPALAQVSAFIAAVVPRTLLAAAACAVGGVVLAALLAPVLGEHFRTGLFSAAFFGGQVGLVFGFLWFALNHVDGRLIWGAIFGVGIGGVVGLVNLVALSQTAYLPDVTAFESVLVGVIAGLVTGVFLAMLRADN